MSDKRPDVLFYHLEHQSLEAVLPSLLEKTLARGWRAVVQVGSEDRLAAIDLALWTYADDSFLPHGTARMGFVSDQPIYLTVGDETPNGAGVRFLVDGAEARSFSGAERFVYVFDGRDSDAVASARGQWKAAKAAGCAVTYWQQSKSGRWEQKA
jgi:DNA polymerase-3 subunit chi